MKVLLGLISVSMLINAVTADMSYHQSIMSARDVKNEMQSEVSARIRKNDRQGEMDTFTSHALGKERLKETDLLDIGMKDNFTHTDALKSGWGSGIWYLRIKVDTLLKQGWQIHYRETYGNQPSNPWPPYNNVWFMFGCASRRSNLLYLAAFSHMSWVRRRRGRYWSWGAYWYDDGYSLGFAPNSHIHLYYGDRSDSGGGHLRMSWTKNGGYRCGQYKNLESNYHWQKVVMYLPNFNYYKLRRGQTPPTGIHLNRLKVSNLWSAGWRYTINPTGYYKGRNYYARITNENLWPPAGTKWMMLGCRSKGSDRMMLGSFARYKVLAPHGRRNHRRRVVRKWEHGTFWYSWFGMAIGYAPTSRVSNWPDTETPPYSSDRRLSWRFPGNGWRCGDVRGQHFNSMQKIVMYWGRETTTTTTTTTLVRLKIVTWVLPEKMAYRILKGKRVVCKGGPFWEWYATIPLDCNLKKGRYTIECLDPRGYGWSGGYIQAKHLKLCKKFKWRGKKMTQKFSL